MDENLDGRRGIREYLFGILEDPVMKSQMEEKLLADDKLAAEISRVEDQLIEQYLDDELSPAERERFIKHFLVAPERKQQLRLHQNLRKYAAAQNLAEPESSPFVPGWRRFFSMPALSYALVFVVVLGLGYGVWRIGFNRSNNVEMAMAELRLAYKGDRPLNSRIVGFDYAPPGDRRGAGTDKDPNKDLKKRAVLTLQEAVSDKRTAESLHGLGAAYLAAENLPDAIRCFEEAAALGPVSARLMSDLGAGYLEAWRKEGAAGKTEMLDKSLRSLDRAIELDPRLAEPRFNRALCLEAMGSREPAKQAWREYLELDPNSKWADEARRNLLRLEENR